MKPASTTLMFYVLLLAPTTNAQAEFKAGAAVVDVTPTQFPVLVNGGMLSRSADEVNTPINARAIVLDDGRERLGIVVVDSCMMPRPLLDEAKALAAQRTKIRPDRMLISASHSHTAPASMGCLGTDADPNYPTFVGIMSHGCSGDIWRRDYTTSAASREENYTVESYAEGLLDIALAAYDTIAYSEEADLAMAEARLNLKYRVPDKQLLEWAQRILDEMGDRPPKSTPEVYAREQIILHQRQSTEVVVQALRIGDIGIATTPNETYALTGLKLKLQSPLPSTMVIELANGGDGYIPPPEQFLLGGYNTWPARSAGLEVGAEPKITETALGLLEKVAGRPRRDFTQSCGPACEAILKAKPAAYWRMDELAGPLAVHSTGKNRDALYEPAVAFFLEGPRSDAFCMQGETNRAAHFAGGRLRSRIANLGDKYSISLWFWNGMPVEGRETTGWMFSRGRDHGLGPDGDHLGIGGTASDPGKLIFLHGNDSEGVKPVAGRTQIERWKWYHVVFVRDGEQVRIHLNGNAQPEIETESSAGFPVGFDRLFFGGRCDNESNWEGRLDEIGVFDRALSAEEIDALSGQ